MIRQTTAIDEHLVTLLPAAAPELEDYHALRYALEEKGLGSAVRTIAITSPVVGDGKTTTAVNLAGALARRASTRVLLVDADLRRPSVARVLGLPAGGRGLAEALADGGCGLPEIAVQVPGTNLHVAAAAAASRHAFELLRTERLPALLDEARRHYDIVVLDTSPLLLVTDSRVLQGAVDGVLLVVGAHRTPRKLLAEAVDLVDPSKLLGTVFNYDDTPLTAYYGYSGYDGAGRAS